jgi:Holliday junction resolvasome RuvABC endonuclease subunit
MNIIAFDLGATIGWACNSPYGVGSKLFTGPRAHRQGQLLDWLPDMLSGGLDLVVYETPFARGRDATRCGWGSAGVIEAAASLAGLPVIDVAVATIKKFATRDGRASKDMMVRAAQRLGYQGSNEHEADAFWLLKYTEENAEKVQ